MNFERDNRQRIKQFWHHKIKEINRNQNKPQDNYVFPRSKQSDNNQNYHQHTNNDNDQQISSIADLYDLRQQNKSVDVSIHNNTFEELCVLGLSNMSELQIISNEKRKDRIKEDDIDKIKSKTRANSASRNNRKINIISNSVDLLRKHPTKATLSYHKIGGKPIKRNNHEESRQQAECKCWPLFQNNPLRFLWNSQRKQKSYTHLKYSSNQELPSSKTNSTWISKNKHEIQREINIDEKEMKKVSQFMY